MLKITKIILIFILLGINYTFANTLIERTISGYKAKIIEYNTSSEIYDIKIGIHPNDGGTLRNIMGEVGGITGVNGVFECPKDYSACGGKNYTINERYVNGEKRGVYKSTGDRVVFGWNKNIEPFLFQTDKINSEKENEIWEGFANHPLLLKEGDSQTELYHELNLIDYKMKTSGTRNFICSNKSGKKIYFGLVYNINIDDLALVLKDFGCYNAINLDAGLSTSFIYNGKYITGPQREILDGVFIVPKDINLKNIENNAKLILKYLLNKTSNLSRNKKIETLEKLNNNLNKISQNIYKENTNDVYEEIEIIEENKENAFSGSINILKEYNNKIIKYENIKVGTRVEIKNKKTIEKLYLINLLRTYTNDLINLEKKLSELEFLRKSELNIKINYEIEY